MGPSQRSPALGVDPAATLDPAAGRPRQFDAVVAAVRDDAGPAGLLLVLDDLHWADIGSLRLLHTVAAEIADAPVLVLGLFRADQSGGHDRGGARFDSDEYTAVLGAIGRERTAARIAVGSLPPAAVAELAVRAAGHPIDGPLLDRIVERSGGNPLFVTELARLVGSVPSGTVPATARDVIGRRLDACEPAVRAALREASVLGRDVPVSLVDVPEGAWDAAAAAGLVELAGPRARFSHVLVQEALYAELAPAHRRRLYARVAERLLDPADLDVRAYHLRASVPYGDGAEAVRVTRAAVARARGQLAYEHAAALLRDTLGLATADGERAELFLDLADCEARAGAVERAWAACQAAADIGRAAVDPAVLADAATVLRGLTRSPLTPQVHAAACEALATLRPPRPCPPLVCSPSSRRPPTGSPPIPNRT